MKGGKTGCTACVPCEVDCCCRPDHHPVLLDFNHGCCDCSQLNSVSVVWNFVSGGAAFRVNNPNPACPVPAFENVPSMAIPDCLAARLAAHGGFQQVEIYYGTDACNDKIPLAIVASLGPASYSIVRGVLCLSPSALCEAEVSDACYVCFIIRANDGAEVFRCARCPEGKDRVIPACSSSSSSSGSSGSSVSGGSSGSSSSGSSDGSGGSSSSGSSGSGGSSGSSSSGSSDGSGGGGGGSSESSAESSGSA